MVIVLVALWALIAWNGNAAAQQQERREPGWEYATYVNAGLLSVWNTSQAKLDGDNAHEVYTRLGGKKPRDRFTNVDMLDHLGERGWELVAIEIVDGGHKFYFKRPAR
jgi:hypothetical protein